MRPWELFLSLSRREWSLTSSNLTFPPSDVPHSVPLLRLGEGSFYFRGVGSFSSFLSATHGVNCNLTTPHPYFYFYGLPPISGLPSGAVFQNLEGGGSAHQHVEMDLQVGR